MWSWVNNFTKRTLVVIKERGISKMYWISLKRVSSGHKKKVDNVVLRYQEKNVLCIIYYFNDLLWYYFLTFLLYIFV